MPALRIARRPRDRPALPQRRATDLAYVLWHTYRLAITVQYHSQVRQGLRPEADAVRVGYQPWNWPCRVQKAASVVMHARAAAAAMRPPRLLEELSVLACDPGRGPPR